MDDKRKLDPPETYKLRFEVRAPDGYNVITMLQEVAPEVIEDAKLDALHALVLMFGGRIRMESAEIAVMLEADPSRWRGRLPREVPDAEVPDAEVPDAEVRDA